VSLVRVAELLAYLCAALAAGGNALANVMQRKASLQEAPDRPFGPRLLLDLVHHPSWLLGFGGLVASFGMQALALGLGPLSAVETIITLELPLTLLAASHVFHGHLGRSEWLSVLGMTAGMAALVAILDPHPGNTSDVTPLTYTVAGGATAATIAALLILGQRGGRLSRTIALGAAAGASFGFTATLIKETVTQLNTHGLLAMLSTWQTYVAAGFGILGLVAVQWALHTGPLTAAQPGFTLMDPLVAILWGIFVYHETTRTGIWLLPATLGAIAIGAGAIRLARSPLLASLNENTVSVGDGPVGLFSQADVGSSR